VWNEPAAIAAVLAGCPLHISGPVDAYVIRANNHRQIALSSDHISANQAFPGEDVRSLVRRGVVEAASDLAAVGADFHGVQIDLRAPADFDELDFTAVGQGVNDALEVMGGQLLQASNISHGEFGVSNTVVGFLDSYQPMSRRSARAEDVVLISGPTGGWNSALALLNSSSKAALSLNEWSMVRDDFVDYWPEIRLGRALASSGLVNGCTDMSDALDRCLRDLIAPLGLDADIDEAAVPLSDSAEFVAFKLGLDAIELSIMGLAGDNRLVITTAPSLVELLQRTAESVGRRLYAIGSLREGSGVVRYRHLPSQSRDDDVRRAEIYAPTFEAPIALRPQRFRSGGRVFKQTVHPGEAAID